MTERPVAVITGASSGIGEASAKLLAKSGFDVVLGARRVDRLDHIAAEIGPAAKAYPLDVTEEDSVREFCANVPRVDVLVNNAGGAYGLEPLAESDTAHWVAMFESNVLGLMFMTRELLPRLEASARGHIINMGSIAGWEAYAGGAGYNVAKFGTNAISQVLRIELNGKPIRVSEIQPGMTETEFSLVRFEGDEERAKSVYAGVTPLVGEDIADNVAWVATRPQHVNIDVLVVRPTQQGLVTVTDRNSIDLSGGPGPGERPVAVITGASAGIGAAAARQFAAAGFDVVLGARRTDRLETLVREIGSAAKAYPLDVGDYQSVREFCARVPKVNVLVNNAGYGIGRGRLRELDPADWPGVIQTNVLGVMYMTYELIEKVIASGRGHVVNIGSTLGFEYFEGAMDYTASKHAVTGVTRTLRVDMVGKPVRVSLIEPGLVETDFGIVRFKGDAERAAKMYEGMTPLTGADVADAAVYVTTRPPHVNIDRIVIKPLDQATVRKVHRRTG
jgi:NADP-dependent 3-hydroxy acid dehydrogenase YdfG